MERWFTGGGVLFAGYDLFRNLVMGNRLKKKKKEAFLKYLLDPGTVHVYTCTVQYTDMYMYMYMCTCTCINTLSICVCFALICTFAVHVYIYMYMYIHVV